MTDDQEDKGNIREEGNESVTDQEEVEERLEGLRTADSETLPMREAACRGSGFSEALLCMRCRHRSWTHTHTHTDTLPA